MAYGMLDDVAIGTMFPNRRALFDASVHRTFGEVLRDAAVSVEQNQSC